MKTIKRDNGRDLGTCPYDTWEIQALKLYAGGKVPYTCEFEAFDKTSPQLAWKRVDRNNNEDDKDGPFVKLLGSDYELEWFDSAPNRANLYICGNLIARCFINLVYYDQKLQTEFVANDENDKLLID